MNKHTLLSLCLVIGVSGCAKTPTESSDSEANSVVVGELYVNDPLEPFNRAMWDLNYHYLDPYFLRPVSLTYVNYVPSPVRTGLSNFLSNLEEPSNMVNSLVMLDGEKALVHFNRFWINSIFGLAGLIDIAGAADIQTPGNQAFGDSLGYHGLNSGPFIMLPLYGPLTVREGAGDLVDGLYFPLNLLTFWQSLGKWTIEGMEDRAALVSQEALLDNSPDPYAFTRNAYLQYKNFKATGNKQVEEPDVVDENVDNYLDEVDEY